MSSSTNASSQYHHSIGPPALSPLSLILICSVIGFLAGCGVWYFFLRVTFKHDFTTNRRLMHQKLMLIKQEEKSEKPIIPHVASPGQDEEKHIEILSQSSVHKRYYYGDISLLDPFGKSHRMQVGIKQLNLCVSIAHIDIPRHNNRVDGVAVRVSVRLFRKMMMIVRKWMII